MTRRPSILKFEGCYHGHVEALDSAGLEAEGLGGPLAVGASPGAASETLVAIFNDIDSVKSLFAQYPDQIAGVDDQPYGKHGRGGSESHLPIPVGGFVRRPGSLTDF